MPHRRVQTSTADLEPAGVGFAIGVEQLALHRAQLARYEAGQHAEDAPVSAGSRSI